MLALTNISLRRGRKVLFEGVSFQIHAGQRLGLIGANGSGKSSLFAMVLGELEADDGELAVDPKAEIADASRKDELTHLVQDQAAAKSAIESLEWEWLEASEKLEQRT